MRYYLAARFSAQAEMRDVREFLHAAGHEVTSSWIDEPTTETGPDGITPEIMNTDPDRCWRFAAADIEDLRAADVVVVFTEAGPSTTGGRHVELGLAIGTRKHVVVVGPRENIFQTLPAVRHYPDRLQWIAAEGAAALGAGEGAA